jgi:hypothetical protein
MAGAAGAAGIANDGAPAGGGGDDGAADDAGGAALEGMPITRVNSPGPAGAGGVMAGALCLGSKLSVNEPGAESGAAEGAAGGVAEGALPPLGVPAPKIRVNSPGAFCDGEPTGNGSLDASDGGVRGLRNSRVNSPG